MEENKNKSELRKIKRNNARLYPIYKMFSWDLLFFYSIEFLFYTITKKVTASEILIINGFFVLFKILMQIPAVAIADYMGKRKSIILGNSLIVIYVLLLMYLPGAIGIIVADFVFSLGFCIKNISEPNLLYDSVSTRGGEGLFSKLDAKGGSFYFLLDGIASLISGYLFVMNNYLPMYICLTFAIISTIISFRFKDVYKVKKDSKNFKIKSYFKDLKNTFKFVFKSKRIKSFILFQIVFCSIIEILRTYNSGLLINIGIQEEQFSMIFAVLALIGSMALALKKPIEKKFKNRTLTFISLSYIGACVLIGVISSYWKTNAIIPIILLLYAVQKIAVSIWFILEAKYLKNFTREDMRNKITFVYEFVGGLLASIFSVLAGILIKYITIENAFLVVGIISLIAMILVLNYMKTRFGLKPEEYSKEDIEF